MCYESTYENFFGYCNTVKTAIQLLLIDINIDMNACTVCVLNIYSNKIYRCINNMIYVLFIYDSGGGGGLVAQSCLTPVTPWVVAYQAFCPCDSPGKNTGVDCQFLLQYMTVLGNK